MGWQWARFKKSEEASGICYSQLYLHLSECKEWECECLKISSPIWIDK